jgi:hypothetical protein
MLLIKVRLAARTNPNQRRRLFSQPFPKHYWYVLAASALPKKFYVLFIKSN